MKKPVQKRRIEPRWPVVLTVLAVVCLLAVLPGRVRLLPIWLSYVVAIAVIAPMAAVTLTAAKARWLRVERSMTLLFFVVVGVGTLTGLAYLIHVMVRRSAEIRGLQLLTSSIAFWVTNVLIFSLLYWQIDRGGPEARLNNASTKPDWLFPQTGASEDVPSDWRPTFLDYLFLGFTTATAFSPTDALPLTSRAKLLMMLESAISLVTIVIVASRAINILGS
ncbi:MAG: hypothetical protein MUP30_00435 [Deltaproteobacteria bacterium]|nr:hypothetical protein [Deltaproteobacteria bacterium]